MACAEFLADWCEISLESCLGPKNNIAQTRLEDAEDDLRLLSTRFGHGLLDGINCLIEAAKANTRDDRITRNHLNTASLIAENLTSRCLQGRPLPARNGEKPIESKGSTTIYAEKFTEFFHVVL